MLNQSSWQSVDVFLLPEYCIFFKGEEKADSIWCVIQNINVRTEMELFHVIAISVCFKMFIKMHLLPSVHVIETRKVVFP